MTDSSQRTVSSERTVAARRITRRGFTIVELLVVIAVIGILMSLITVAAYNALWAARQTRIKLEVDNISMALKAFKEKYGSYPPINFYDPMGPKGADLRAFVAKAFPRYAQSTVADSRRLENDLIALGIDLTKKNGDPAVALVFWLSGFSPDVTSPFTGGGTRAKLFDFDPTRVINTVTGKVANTDSTDLTTYKPGQWVYMPPSIDAPYVYFDSRNYLSRDPVVNNPPPNSFTYNDKGTVSPYWNDLNNNRKYFNPSDPSPNPDQGETFVNPDSFQLISAGQDGNYGTAAPDLWHLYPTGFNVNQGNTGSLYAPEEHDNVTNFCQKNNLEDAKPN